MSTPPAAMDPLLRARSYPYLIPDHSYLFENGLWSLLDWHERLARNRVPVIGCGSNRSPEQLARKFADFETVSIPVQRAWLEEFDTVYAAHITGYGSVSATLQHVAGATVEVSVTWLTEEQLARMDETEGRGTSYDLVLLEGLRLHTEQGEDHAAAYAYVFRGGCLRHEDDHVGLDEITARNRPHRAWRQPAALAAVHSRLREDDDAPEDVDAFIRENIADRDARLRRERALQRDAIGFRWPKARIIP